MPPVLSDADRETVKRTVPKPANKILAVAVARLYIAYPDRQRWTYTGLQGAAVLANDLIGNTFWIKLVDISAAGKGVLWDQEIYEPFYYNQDRTFFHSFELEDCLAALSFVDEKEAKKFKKKMDARENDASKATKNTPFSSSAGSGASMPIHQEKHHSRFSNLLHGHRPSSQAQPVQSIIPPRQAPPTAQYLPPQATNGHAPSELDAVDPSWRGMLQELMKQGITEDQIADNAEFIKSYILEQQKAGTGGDGGISYDSRVKAPPPPPAIPAGGHRPISPQNTGSTTASRRGPPPAPPASRRSRVELPSAPSPPAQVTPPRTPSPPRDKFKAPPAIADIGKYADSNASVRPLRSRPTPAATTPSSGPQPPPRPPKTPENEVHESKSRWGVPPPFVGERHTSVPVNPGRSSVPIPPARSSAPAPPPRAREASSSHAVPPATAIAPPLPPKIPISNAPSTGPPPPPPPARREVPSAAPAMPPRSNQTAPPLPPINNAPPPPPPFPSSHAPPPAGSGPPPPPPLPPPSSAGPPAPPPPPRGPTAPALPASAGGRDDLLASIRNAGGPGIGGLRKVRDTEKRDRSAAVVPGSEAAASATSPTSAAAGGAPAGGLAGSLAAALAARNKKVSASDDEDDKDDDWD